MTSKSMQYGAAAFAGVLIVGVGLLFWTKAGVKGVGDLAKDLTGTDAHLRHEASRQLARLGPAARDAAPALGTALADPDKRVRVHAAKCLAELGADANPAVDSMIAALGETDPDGRYYLVKALSKIDLDSRHANAVPGLTRLMTDENPKVRYYAVKCVKAIGPAANSAIPTLARLASDPDKDVRDLARSTTTRLQKQK